MKKWQERIMTASFGRLLKRWIIAALCVILLGGGVSAALLCGLLALLIHPKTWRARRWGYSWVGWAAPWFPVLKTAGQYRKEDDFVCC